jgi:hypothetical protein
VAGFGLSMEAVIRAVAPTQCAVKRTGGGAQQSITVKVTFFVNIKILDEFVIFTPFLNNFNTRPQGKTYDKDSVIRPMIYPPVIAISTLANEEFLNGDTPIAIPIPIDNKVLIIKYTYIYI